MKNQLFVCLAALACSAAAFSLSPARAANVSFVLDSSLSELSVSGDVAGIVPIDPQAPGSLSTNITGNIETDLTGSSIEFIPGTLLDAVAQPGPFIPVNGPADFAGQVISIAPVISAFATISDFTSTAEGPARGLSGAGEFGATGIDFDILSGVFDFMIPGFDLDALDLDGLIAGNEPAVTGTVEVVGNQFKLTLPVNVTTVLPIPDFGLDANFTISGELVGFAPVPEPATLVLLTLGAVGFLAVAVGSRQSRR